VRITQSHDQQSEKEQTQGSPNLCFPENPAQEREHGDENQKLRRGK
jgi:hypothetical protein